MASWLIVTFAVLKVLFWLIGVAFAFYGRRWGLCAAFAACVYASAVRGYQDTKHPHTVAVDLVVVLGLLAAGFIVASYIAAQDPRAGRPSRWTL